MGSSRIYRPFRNPHEVNLNVSIYNGRVCFRFNRPVDLFHVGADEALQIARSLLERADKLEGKDSPIVLATH